MAALIFLFILTTAVAAFCWARERRYRIAEEREGDYLNEQLQKQKEALEKVCRYRRDAGIELRDARNELVQRLRALSDCQRDRENARTAAKAFCKVVDFSLLQGWVARDAEIAMAELAEQYPWVRDGEATEAASK